ncbi:MAG: calcium-binding protein [Acidobacteria bacterium]|nr:MAG: calcium-binding protein [Acidobacteriota bacterium]
MAESILNDLMQQLQGGGIGEISKTLGLNDDQVSSVVTAAMPALMGAFSRNAGSQSGADALFGALAGKHSGGILGDVVGALAGGKNADTGILKHAFGAKQSGVEQALSAGSGVDMASVGKIMAMVAPLVMGALGKAQRTQGLDASGTAAMIQQEGRVAQQQAPQAMDMLGKLLDADGDGDVMDDLGKLGSSLLGSFLK